MFVGVAPLTTKESKNKKEQKINAVMDMVALLFSMTIGATMLAVMSEVHKIIDVEQGYWRVCRFCKP